MEKRFEDIDNERCSEIINYLMSSPDIPDDERLRFKLRLCIEEAVVNVASYAYKGGKGWLQVSLTKDCGQLEIKLVDAGMQFNPLLQQDPDTSVPLEEKKISGLGIYWIKSLSDDLQYEYKDNYNNLTIKINL